VNYYDLRYGEPLTLVVDGVPVRIDVQPAHNRLAVKIGVEAPRRIEVFRAEVWEQLRRKGLV
jgi:sRNA-binding carbon storage regulator CsrA